MGKSALGDEAIANHLTEALLWLCSIASPIGEERELCDGVAQRLEKLPLAGPIRRYGDSIVVPLVRRPRGPSSTESKRHPHVALVGHLDTVRTENGPARIEGDRCFGAGSSDMKSGLAVMIALAELHDPSSWPCELSLVFYAREEGPYAENELGPVLEQDHELNQVDIAVCMEPSDNRLHLGCMGSIHAALIVKGRTAHSARPWEGENAITNAVPVLADIAATKPRESNIDGLHYRSALTMTQARDGGRGRNVVPDEFRINLNHRFAPDISLEEAKKAIEDVVRGRADIVYLDESPAAMPNANHPLVRSLIECGVRGVEPKHAWTDVARFAQKGIVAINFGPGENRQAHQKNESTALPLLSEGYAIMKRWLSAM